MTNLQLARNNWWEARRHNVQMEEENQRHNLRTEELSAEANAETRRANQAKEELTRSEQSLEAAKIEESVRSNMAREAENLRHNSMTEKLEGSAQAITSVNNWKKNTLQEQRQEVQNFVDKMNAYKTKMEGLLKSQEFKANLPAAQRSKILNDISMSNRQLAENKRQFDLNYDLAKKATDAETKKKAAEAMLTVSKNLQTNWNTAKDIVATIFEAVDNAASGAKK